MCWLARGQEGKVAEERERRRGKKRQISLRSLKLVP